MCEKYVSTTRDVTSITLDIMSNTQDVKTSIIGNLKRLQCFMLSAPERSYYSVVEVEVLRRASELLCGRDVKTSVSYTMWSDSDNLC